MTEPMQTKKSFSIPTPEAMRPILWKAWQREYGAMSRTADHTERAEPTDRSRHEIAIAIATHRLEAIAKLHACAIDAMVAAGRGNESWETVSRKSDRLSRLLVVTSEASGAVCLEILKRSMEAK